MAQKIAISKSSFNVLIETDPDNLIYSSDYDTLKYYVAGTSTISLSGGDTDGETNVTHGLGYTPFFIAYLELDFSVGAGSWAQVPYNFGTGFGIVTITASVDSSKIYFTAKTSDPSGFGAIDLNFSYKIFRNDTLL